MIFTKDIQWLAEAVADEITGMTPEIASAPLVLHFDVIDHVSFTARIDDREPTFRFTRAMGDRYGCLEWRDAERSLCMIRVGAHESAIAERMYDAYARYHATE